MADNRIYIDFHVIQTVPPSCVNRDDTGRPKTAVYGGANRARVSSQAWKHSMREMFKELVSDEKLGYRTKYAAALVAEKIKKLDSKLDADKADKAAAEALSDAGLKVNEKNAIIIEDDFESEFSPSRKPEETVLFLNKGKNVIYVNTFTRTIGPFLRVAYMVVPEDMADKFKQTVGFLSCTVPTPEQYVIAELLENGEFERHINRVRRKKREELKN